MKNRGERQDLLVKNVLEELESCFCLQEEGVFVTEAQFLHVGAEWVEEGYEYYDVTTTFEQTIKSVLILKLFLLENSVEDFIAFARLVDL